MKLKKIAIAFCFSLLFLLSSSSMIHAKRIIPKVAPKTSGKVTPVTNTSRIGAKVKFRSDRKAIVVTFTNLSVASNLSYTLTYESKGLSQGAGGSVAQGTAEPVVRELLFGTCSNNICRYDTGIKNAKLIVTSTLKNGKKVVKTFRLRV